MKINSENHRDFLFHSTSFRESFNIGREMIYLKISEDFFHKHLDCMVEYGQLNVYLAEFIRPRNDKNKKKTDLRQQLPTKSVSFEFDAVYLTMTTMKITTKLQRRQS